MIQKSSFVFNMDKRELHNSTPPPPGLSPPPHNKTIFFNEFLDNQIKIKASNMVSRALTDYAYYLEIFYVIIAHTIGLILSLTESFGWQL